MKTTINCSVVYRDNLNHIVAIGKQLYCNGSRVASSVVLKEALITAGYSTDVTFAILRKAKTYVNC